MISFYLKLQMLLPHESFFKNRFIVQLTFPAKQLRPGNKGILTAIGVNISFAGTYFQSRWVPVTGGRKRNSFKTMNKQIQLSKTKKKNSVTSNQPP